MKFLNVPIDSDLKDRLDAFAEHSEINKKKIVELALRKYLDENEVK